MKKLIFLAIVIFFAYSAYQRSESRKREKLAGVWSNERAFNGGWYKLILNLKSEGDATVEIDATFQGRSASKEAFGKWRCVNSSLKILFDHGEIPVYTNGKEYGGHILTLDEKTLSYKSDQGVETWTRIR